MSRIGGWEIEVAVNELPQKVATGFKKVFENITGAEYTPLIYVGRQLVNGINHAIIAEQKIIGVEIIKNLVLVILNEKPMDEIESEFALVNIIPIVEGGHKYGGTNIVDEFRIPDDAQTAFDELFKNFLGSLVEPLLYVGAKVVNGIEFKFIVKLTGVSPKAPVAVKVLTINTHTKDIFFEDIFR